MMRDILSSLHAVMTGCPVPTSHEGGAALLCTPGIGRLAGVNVVLGTDRISGGIHDNYFPLVVLDDDGEKDSDGAIRYGVRVTAAVIVPPYLGALYGYEGEAGRVLGLLDISEAVKKTILENTYLPDGRGGYLTTGITGIISIERDADSDAEG